MTTSFEDCGIPTTMADLERRYGDQAWWGELFGFVIGTWGDSGAWLSVNGPLNARGVLLDSHTPVQAGSMSAIVLAGRGWPGLVPDVIDGENDLFVSAVRDRGSRFLDFHAARNAAKRGHPVLESEQEALWRERKGL